MALSFMESTAKLFRNGRSQAVRLPKDFRLKGTEVKIRKEGEKVILEPIEKTRWPDGFWDIFKSDPEFEIPKAMPLKGTCKSPRLLLQTGSVSSHIT
jgi:antitoxin VapB